MQPKLGTLSQIFFKITAILHRFILNINLTKPIWIYFQIWPLVVKLSKLLLIRRWIRGPLANQWLILQLISGLNDQYYEGITILPQQTKHAPDFYEARSWLTNLEVYTKNLFGSKPVKTQPSPPTDLMSHSLKPVRPNLKNMKKVIVLSQTGFNPIQTGLIGLNISVSKPVLTRSGFFQSAFDHPFCTFLACRY